MYLTLIFYPFIGALTTLLFGRFFGLGSFFISALSIFIPLLITTVALFDILLAYSPVYIDLAPWFDSPILQISYSFVFDYLSLGMLFIITLISFLVHIFAIYYMYEDNHYVSFMSYLNLFTGFMLILVASNNLLFFFLGWEGVGLMSYLLINYWFTSVAAVQASFKAFIINNIGDIFLLLGALTFLFYFNSLDFEIIFALSSYLPSSTSGLITILFIVAVMSNSAQIGLHTWLADAMEGPTPVSALLHAATMVTAGIFLLIRFSPFFNLGANATYGVLAFVGAITTIFAASSGLVQNDFNNVIAYSTSSQLGYMTLACGLYNFDISFFHLINHAYFNALLFLSSGVLIHTLFNDQDLSNFGGFFYLYPFLYIIFLIASLSLAGFPFLSGFYSNDLILESSYFSFTLSSYFLFWIAALTVTLTSFYSFRLIYFIFYVTPSSLPLTTYLTSYSSFYSESRNNYYYIVPLCLLSLFAIFFGYLSKDLFVGLGAPYLSSLIVIDLEFLPLTSNLLPLFMSTLGFFLAYLFYVSGTILHISNPLVYYPYIFLSYNWYFDYFFNFVSSTILYYSYLFPFNAFDRGFLEVFGSLGFNTLFTSFSSSAYSLFNSGLIFNYTLFFLIAFSTVLAFALGFIEIWFLSLIFITFLSSASSH